jgi:hypothetical protein
MPILLLTGPHPVLALVVNAVSPLPLFLATALRGEFQPWAWIATSTAIQCFAIYLTSKILANAASRWANALKVMLHYWAGAACVLLLFGTGVWIAAAYASQVLAATSVLLLPLLVLGVLLTGPRSVYKISWTRSLVFVSASGLLLAAGHLLIPALLGNAMDTGHGIKQAKEVLTKLSGYAPAGLNAALRDLVYDRPEAVSDDAIAADRAIPLAQRHAAIQRIYGALETRRVTLNGNDENALKAYARDETRYKVLLLQLQADAAAAPPHPTDR